jgi:hypothetical protein
VPLFENASDIINQVWRFDFRWPGFYLADLGTGVDSRTMRSAMVSLKSELSDALAQFGKRFVYLSLVRFDQQVTTKFHLDGAPPESLLMLGYEPSHVRSRLSLADYSRCAFDRGLTPEQFLSDLNPMFHRGNEALSSYITELPPQAAGHSRILLINNSRLPFTDAGTNPLGVFHKAEIINPDKSEQRVVNSIMLTTAEVSAPDPIGDEQEAGYVITDEISSSIYRGKAES